MTLKPIVHEIRIQNQVIFLDPPIESARQTWLQQLHDWLGKCRPGCTPDFGLMFSFQVWFAGYDGFKVRDMKLGFKCKATRRRKYCIPRW